MAWMLGKGGDANTSHRRAPADLANNSVTDFVGRDAALTYTHPRMGAHDRRLCQCAIWWTHEFVLGLPTGISEGFLTVYRDNKLTYKVLTNAATASESQLQPPLH